MFHLNFSEILKHSFTSNYILIDIIGIIPDSNKNKDKIDGYYQITNGILLHYFAINFLQLEPRCVKIFAYGNKESYNKFIYTNNKCYFQLDKHDIFQFDHNSIQKEFIYFSDFSFILNEIDSLIKNNPSKKIIIFLDDHLRKFSDINYFQLYKITMMYPANQFLIFNDSCYSGSMINLVESYNQFYKFKINNEIQTNVNAQVIFSFYKLFTFVLKGKSADNLYNIIIQMIDCYQHIKIPSCSIQKVLNLEIQSNFDPDLSVNEVCDFANEINIFGFKIVQDILNFQIIFNSAKSILQGENDDATFKKSLAIFTKFNLDLIVKLYGKNFNLFMKTLETLYLIKDHIDFELDPHQNVEIITSTDEKHVCVSFSSIKVNKVTKIYPGSPAMSSFIKEMFLNSYSEPLNFENIVKEISVFEGKNIFFHGRINQNSREERKKRCWIHLFPMHYKQTQQEYSCQIDEDMLLKVAALRDISFSNVIELKKVAKSLVHREDEPNKLNSSNDCMADIVSLAAILNSNNKEVNSLISKCIVKTPTFRLKNLFGIEMICLIMESTFGLSNSPVKMTAVILNCINAAIKFEIYQNLQSSSSDLENLILKRETTTFIQHKSKQNCNSNDDLEFIDDIAKAAFILLNPESVFYSFIIASSLLQDPLMDNVKITDLALSISSLPKKDYQRFIHDKNEKLNIELAECYLLSYAKSSLNKVNSICDLQIKNDVMRFVAQKLQYLSSISMMKLFVENFEFKTSQLFIDTLINPIEEVLSDKKISTFFIPSILASLQMSTIIDALYISDSTIESNWYNEAINKIKMIIIKNPDKEYCNTILDLAEFSLISYKDVNDKAEFNDEVDKIKINIKNQIIVSLNKILKLIDSSILRARENISKNMNTELLIEQINEYYDFLKRINEKKFDDKFHNYLNSSFSDLTSSMSNVNNFIVSKNPDKGFNAGEHLINTDKLFKRASKELYTVAHIFDISDDYVNKNRLLSEIPNKNKIDFAIRVMAARTFNIVEITPIKELLDKYSDSFVKEDGKNPTFKELMCLCGANIYILSEKDTKRLRYTFDDDANKEKKNSNDNCENGQYYSEDYYEDTIQMESDEEKLYFKEYQKFTFLQNHKFYKDQISLGKIEKVRNDLDLGFNDWTYEAWLVFLQCFNDRLNCNLKIKFDPNNDYSDEKYPIKIDKTISFIDTFYPTYQIDYFMQNKNQIERFIGNNRIHEKEIQHEIIKTFDDVDRIVTPLHMFRETYKERTEEQLKLIFEQ